MSLTIHPISSGILLLYIIVLSSATANKRNLSLSLSSSADQSYLAYIRFAFAYTSLQ